AGDVAGDGEVDVVGLEAILDRAALVAGGAVGVLELEVLAVLGLLELLEDRVVRLLGNGEADDRESLGVAVTAASVVDWCSDEWGGCCHLEPVLHYHSFPPPDEGVPSIECRVDYRNEGLYVDDLHRVRMSSFGPRRETRT